MMTGFFPRIFIAHVRKCSLCRIGRAVFNLLIVFCFFAFLPPAFAAESELPSAHDVDYCTPYIQRAERKYKIPRGLLMAIAMQESGSNGRPWPWALNVGGEGIYPQTYEAATKYLRDSSGKTRKDVAVGCMQVYLAFHVHKFSAPEWLLHPEYNVNYGAQLLRKLYNRHGNWSEAVAFYHAATNKRAQYDYVCAVLSRLNKIRGTKPDAEAVKYCNIMPKKPKTQNAAKSKPVQPKTSATPNKNPFEPRKMSDKN